MNLRVLLIDDHALFRAGLQGLLEQRGITVVASVGSASEGVRLACETEVDVVLADLRMPGEDGIAVVRRLRHERMDVPVVLLTMSDEERDLVSALREGASGYLLKDMEPDQLVVALRKIVGGEMVVAPGLTGLLAKVVQQGSRQETARPAPPFADLTPREREILCYVSEGRSNKLIARELGITDGTVKLHVKAILRKLSAHSRVEAAVMAVEGGLCQKL